MLIAQECTTSQLTFATITIVETLFESYNFYWFNFECFLTAEIAVWIIATWYFICSTLCVERAFAASIKMKIVAFTKDWESIFIVINLSVRFKALKHLNWVLIMIVLKYEWIASSLLLCTSFAAPGYICKCSEHTPVLSSDYGQGRWLSITLIMKILGIKSIVMTLE